MKAKIESAIREALPKNLVYTEGNAQPKLRVNWDEDGQISINYQHGGPGNAYQIQSNECYLEVGMDSGLLDYKDVEEEDEDEYEYEELASSMWIEKNISIWVEDVIDAMEKEEAE